MHIRANNELSAMSIPLMYRQHWQRIRQPLAVESSYRFTIIKHNKDSHLKHLFFLKQFTVIVLTAILITTCNVTENNEAKTSSQTEITVTEIPKRATTDVRDSYVLFSISSLKDKTNYHLAVKEKGKTAPTTTEMTEGALKRNLSTNSINILIAQRLNAPMIAFAKEFFADNTYQALGTGMTMRTWSNNKSAIVLDDQASGSDAWISESVLKPSTEYTLYGMQQEGISVAELLTLTTDAGSSPATGTNTYQYVDTTLEKEHIEITMHADEYYVFPLQIKSTLTNILSFVNVFYTGQVSDSFTLDIMTMDLEEFIRANDPGYDGQLLLFDKKDSRIETVHEGMYVLMQTAMLNLPDPLNMYFGKNYTFSSGHSISHLYFSHLKIQE